MKTFYVSLVKDLLGCYLKFEAESETALRQYLQREYLDRNHTWKLPWCAIYAELPQIPGRTPIVIEAQYAGEVYEEEKSPA